jgi:hypothetical protein
VEPRFALLGQPYQELGAPVIGLQQPWRDPGRLRGWCYWHRLLRRGFGERLFDDRLPYWSRVLRLSGSDRSLRLASGLLYLRLRRRLGPCHGVRLIRLEPGPGNEVAARGDRARCCRRGLRWWGRGLPMLGCRWRRRALLDGAHVIDGLWWWLHLGCELLVEIPTGSLNDLADPEVLHCGRCFAGGFRRRCLSGLECLHDLGGTLEPILRRLLEAAHDQVGQPGWNVGHHFLGLAHWIREVLRHDLLDRLSLERLLARHHFEERRAEPPTSSPNTCSGLM